jgi:hypothetical protein
MFSIKPTLIIDCISTIWVIIITYFALFWLPTSGFKTKNEHNQNVFLPKNYLNNTQLLGLWLRNITLIVIGILILGYFNLLNWLTMTLLYGGCISLNYLKNHDWKIAFFQKTIQSKIINLVDFLDRGLLFSDVIKKISNNSQKTAQQLSDRLNNLVTRQGIVFVILLTAVLGFTLLLRWQYPLSELRFSHPDNYNTLLITRQLLARDYPDLNHLPIFPVLAAIISLLGSIEPMQVIRFLSPIIGTVLVLSVGYIVIILNKNAYAGLVSMFALGIYLFTSQTNSLEIAWLNAIVESLNSSLVRQWTGNELELGTIFLLLGLGYCWQSFQVDEITLLPFRKTIAFKVNLLCSIILVAITAPSLLIIFAIALIVAIADPKLALTAIVLTWIMLAIFAVMSQGKLIWLQSFLLTLPVALSLLVALLFIAISNFVKIFFPQRGEIFCLGIIFSLSINFLLPLAPSLIYVEYDMAARKSLEIKKLFPPHNWTLVAPVEQLTQIYGEGWYQDLALFVQQYADKANESEFNFPVSGEDLLIMVEKIPFVTFPHEADLLPNSVLSDLTYQYYRSSAGRASLEYEALQMCEAYSRHHAGSSIYYEDQELRIYHFSTNLSTSKKALDN